MTVLDPPARLAAAQAHIAAANRAVEAGDPSRAADHYRLALDLVPGAVELGLHLAQLYKILERPADAEATYRRMLAIEPRLVTARLGLVLDRFQSVYADRAQLLQARAQALADLTELEAALAGGVVIGSEAALINANWFEIAYQGLDDAPLMRRYGAVLAEIVRRTWPGAGGPAAVPWSPGQPIRVGFVTGHLHAHSVTKLFGAWIERLDRARFQIYAVAPGAARDAVTERLTAACDGVVTGHGALTEWAAAVRALGLHALIFLDVGMSAVPSLLAAFRLAPVQAMAWGHPVTSGLPTMDYFLSADLMEPPNGDDHYVERLVRLPGLSICYTPPAPPPRLGRADFGLPEGRVLYLLTQNLQKYLPQHDGLLVALAQRLPEARLVVLESARTRAAADAFAARLGRAFSAAGLAFADHVIRLPPQPSERYLALLPLADIHVDGVGWSGGVTSLEAIMAGLPTAALPTALMRGRHTAALLAAMDLPELIALTPDGLVDRLVRLGADPAYRARIAGLIAERRGRLVGDERPIRALEAFLVSAVRSV